MINHKRLFFFLLIWAVAFFTGLMSFLVVGWLSHAPANYKNVVTAVAASAFGGVVGAISFVRSLRK